MILKNYLYNGYFNALISKIDLRYTIIIVLRLMIKDKNNKFIKLFGGNIAEKWILRHFASLKFIGEIIVKNNHSCVMLMNHCSYNDGAILYRICRKILKKEFKAVVIEEQLNAFPLLRYVGCFSVSKKSRNMIESLNYAAELLQNPKVMLGVYPQGGLYSMHLNRVHFESGLGYIFKQAKTSPSQVFFGVTLLDYLESFKPIARVYLIEYEGQRKVEEMEKAYNQFYAECKKKQQHLFNPPAKVIDK